MRFLLIWWSSDHILLSTNRQYIYLVNGALLTCHLLGRHTLIKLKDYVSSCDAKKCRQIKLANKKASLHRRLVEENGDCLDFAAVLVNPIQILDLKVCQTLAKLSLLEHCNILFQLVQISGEVQTLQLDVVLASLISNLPQRCGRSDLQRSIGNGAS